MKKFLSFILASALSLCFCIGAAAETVEKSFPMALSTGLVNVKSDIKYNANFVPEDMYNDSICIQENITGPNVKSITLRVEGVKNANGFIVTSDYKFTNFKDSNFTQRCYGDEEGLYWRLVTSSNPACNGDYIINSFVRIYSMELIVEGTLETREEKIYNDWYNTKIYGGDTFNGFVILSNFVNHTTFTDTITQLISEVKTYDYVSKTVKYDYPIIYNTDINNDGIITREEVIPLSYSAYGEGLGIKGFEGLASQAGAFFNKKTNGMITFELTSADTIYSDVWRTGGVPSSYPNFLDYRTVVDGSIGLFFNYENTGNLMAISRVKEDGIVTFDITDILNDIGTNSLATIKSIYYGLIGGINYTNEPRKGIKVSKVILSYEEEEEEPIVETDPIITTTTTTTTVEVFEDEPEEEESIYDDDEYDDEDTDEDDEADEDDGSFSYDDDDSYDDNLDDSDDETGIDVADDLDDDIDEDTIADDVVADDDINIEVPDEEVEDDAIINVTPTEDDDENPPTGIELTLIPIGGFMGVLAIVTRKRKRK